MNPLQPLFSKVYVEPINEAQSSQTNIKIPVSSLLKGKVLFVGTTSTDALKPGATVLYEKGQGNPFHHEGVDGLFFEEKQLICVL